MLSHLRQAGRAALALKPFCTGDRSDAVLLHALQDGDLTLDQINPFYFKEPVAPVVAARIHRRSVTLQDVLSRILSIARKLSSIEKQKSTSQNPACLLIEGIGGLLVPLGEGPRTPRTLLADRRGLPPFSVADLIARLNCRVIVAGANRLGAINHTLLTTRFLQSIDIQDITVVLSDASSPSDLSLATRSNPRILTRLLSPVPLLQIPFFGPNLNDPVRIKKIARKFQKTLAQICR